MSKNILDNIVISIVVLGSIVILPLMGKSSIATFVLLPFGFIYFALQNHLEFSKDKIIIILILFFLWSCFTSFFALNLDRAFLTQRRFLIVIIYVLTIFLYIGKSLKNVRYIYWLQIISLIILIVRVFYEGVDFDLTSTGRLDKVVNANTYGYYIFSGIFSAFFIYNFYRKKKSAHLFLLIGLIIPSVIISLVSASRGGLIILSLSVFGGSIISFGIEASRSVGKRLAIMFIVALGFLQGGNAIYQKISHGSLVVKRMEKFTESAKEEKRAYHIFKAIDVGLDYPIVGVGGGNYALVPKNVEFGSFSHCSYTEAFANYGLPGLFFLLLMYYYSFGRIRAIAKHNLYKHHKSTKLLMGLFLINFMIYNIIYVTYLTFEFMGMYIATIMHAKLLAANNIRSINTEV